MLKNTRRVSRGEPCPVCNHATWCLVALNGAYALCMRTGSDHPAKSGAGHIHKLKGGTPGNYHTPAPPSKTPPPVSSACDGVYRRFLSMMPLSKAHRDFVRSKGLDPKDAVRIGYGTLPLQGRAKACRALQEMHDLAGVPGFYVADGEHGPYWTFVGSPGLLIPVRGPDGRIRGLRTRPDDAKKAGGKYQWFSSGAKAGGVGSGAHCHVARPPGQATDPAVWITEGELKADIAAGLLNAVVLSIPGVSIWQRALPDLAALLPSGGRVVLAIDADWREKPSVHGALWNLILCCSALGYQLEVALWDPKHKGIDNLLTASLLPTRSDPSVVPSPLWPLKVTARLAAVTSAAPATGVELAMMREAIREMFQGLSPMRSS